jgi:hypothetical protein
MNGIGGKLWWGLDDYERGCFGEWLMELEQNNCILLWINPSFLVQFLLDLPPSGNINTQEWSQQKQVKIEKRTFISLRTWNLPEVYLIAQSSVFIPCPHKFLHFANKVMASSPNDRDLQVLSEPVKVSRILEKSYNLVRDNRNVLPKSHSGV